MFSAGRVTKDDEPIRPMTLGSMRQHGVRGFKVPMDIIVNFSKRKGSESLMLCGAHPVRHCGTTRSQRLGRAGRRVPRRLVLHFSVKLCADQDDGR